MCLWILSGYYDYFHDGIWYYFGSITLDVMLLMSCCYEDLMLIHVYHVIAMLLFVLNASG